MAVSLSAVIGQAVSDAVISAFGERTERYIIGLFCDYKVSGSHKWYAMVHWWRHL